MEGLRAVVETESEGRKCFIGIGATIAFASAATIGAIYIAWLVNVNKIQSSFEDLCDQRQCTDDEEQYWLYDVIWVIGPFTDSALAKEYRNEILPLDSDDEMYKGCRWSIIYSFCGITLLIIAANALL
mgnify:FL=1